MKPSIAASLISSGSIPLALAWRARRDRPMCARLAERFAISFFHRVLSGVLARRWTGFNPLAFTAAKKFERMLAKLFVVKPEAAGITAASLALIARRSSAM